jgi:glyoxylase-like metal-dependent hydrolase (beta-lactamase superfamily II)
MKRFRRAWPAPSRQDRPFFNAGQERVMKRMMMAAMAAALGMGALGAGAAAAETEAVKLWRLDCGTIKVGNLDLFSDSFAYVGQKRTLTDSCYLIAHGTDYLLWDTGLPAGLKGAPFDDKAPLSPSLTRTLDEQLATLGVKPEQIALVGISHYHFDHTGQASGFAKAKLLIGRADLEALKTEPVPFGADPALLAPWLKGGAPLEEVTGDKDIYGDGSVTMLSMPGHTPGSYALLVKLKEKGPVLLSGDIVHFEEQFKVNGVPGFNTDRADSLASMDRMQKIAKALKATLVVQHDADDIGKLPAFPTAAE